MQDLRGDAGRRKEVNTMQCRYHPEREAYVSCQKAAGSPLRCDKSYQK
jgi:hypothetical protein